MNKLKPALLILSALTFANLAPAQRQMENLGRGVVAMRTGSSSVYVGWRLLGTDPDDTKFNLYRVTGGVTNLLTAGITNSCNFVDSGAAQASAHSWFVQPILNGVTQANSVSYSMPANAAIQQYLNIPLQQPPGGTSPPTADGDDGGGPYIYNANDCSAADVDGDGEYEIILKWDPSNAKDNAQSGFTGNTILDCYKQNGTRLWRINLGPNIRSGAHYMDFMVYDFDGNGKAELMCRTGPGARDGLGTYVAGTTKWQNANGPRPTFNDTDSYRDTGPNGVNGYVLAGPEFLSVFNGETGEELATATYYPKRDQDNNDDNPTSSRMNTVWGDNYGNRIDRFLAGVAYCDGIRPSGIFCRGYYTRAYLAAWDWRNGSLSLRWTFNSNDGNPANLAFRGQGAHSLTIGDVDGDGKDEITYGACVIDDNGTGRYSTGLGHGDALHMSDMNPTRPGIEVWMVHESPSSYGPNGLEFRDARNGSLISSFDGQNADVGRGVAIDIDPRYPGYEMWGSRGGLMTSSGAQIWTSHPGSMNFACWWDADTIREILDGTTISKWNYANNSSSSILSPGGLSSNNGTKSTPGLSADLFGDWREEVIWRTSDNLNLRIYTTTTVATNRIYTLMHDPHYRVAIAWQNTGYNQPPHPGFYIGPDMYPPPLTPNSDAQIAWRGGSNGNAWDAATTTNWFVNGIWTNNVVTNFSNNSVLFDMRGSNNSSVNIVGSLTPSKVTVYSPSNFTFSGNGSLSGGGKLFKAGPGRLTIGNTNSFTGTTYLSGGQLIVNGALDGSPVTVEARGEPWGRARIGGSGRLGQGATVQKDCGVIVGGGTSSAGTLTISNQMIELGNVLNQFDLSSDPTGLTNANDRVNVFGNLTLTGTNTIEINQLNNFLGGGVYPLFTYTGTLTGGLANLVLSGSFIQPVSLTNPPGMIGLVSVVPAASPNAPTNLVAGAVGAFQINLVWNDNSTNEAAFIIERSLNGINFSQLDSVAGGTTFYPDSGLTPNTTYYYRVRGTNLAGASGYSPIAFATTTATPPSVTWRGDGTSNLWDIATTPNWFNGTSLTFYGDGSAVMFDDSGSNNPTIAVVGTVQPGTVTVNASKTYTLGGTGVIGGTNGLVKSGSGTLTLSGNNIFAGTTTLDAGTISLNSTTGASSNTIVLNGGSLTLNSVGAPATTGNPLLIQSNATLTITSGNNNQALSGAWSGGGTLNVSVVSGGTFSARGSMTGFTGTVVVGSTGTFRFFGSTGSSSATFDLGSGNASIVNRDGSTTIRLGALVGGSGTFLRGRSSGNGGSGTTYEIGGKNLNTTFSGQILNGNDVVSINKLGAGAFTMAGSNSYSGTTTVSAGTLLVNGNESSVTSALTVATAGTLGGDGIIGGNTTVNGKLAPGTSIGTITFNQNLTLASGSTSLFELTKLPLTNDVVRVLGNVTFGGALNLVNIAPDSLEEGDSFQLFDATNYTGWFSSFTLPALDSGLTWYTNALGTNGRLTVIVNTNISLFSNVSAAPRVTSAIISWDTISNTTSQVEYGLTPAYDNSTLLNASPQTSHAMLLTGLMPDTNYFFRVLAQSGTNVLRSSQYSFSTSGSLIVDNPDALYSGSWTLGTSAPDKYGTYYQYTLATDGFVPGATATYVPNIIVPGLYNVSIWHPAGGSNPTNTPVTIYFNSGSTSTTVDQTTNGGSWLLLVSSLDFAAGTGGFAVLGNNTGSTNVVVVADAMRWSYDLSQDKPADNSVPSWWSDFYFGGAVDGAIDSDGDGFSNHAEYILGTDPLDIASRLQMSHARNSNGIQISFSPVQGGRLYELAGATNLNTGSWTVMPITPAVTNFTGVFSVTNSTAPGATFYRVSVRLAP